MEQRSRIWLRDIGIVTLIWAAFNLPLLLGIRVLPGDAVSEFYPMVYFNVHSIHQGLAPWWNPYIFSGYPQIADPQALLFSPLFMAWMLLRADPGSTWFVWAALLHLLMGGIAMQLLLSRFTHSRGRIGPLIGAAVFMAGGVAAGRMQHVPIICAYSYAPVILLALRYFVDRPGYLRGLMLGFCAGAMLTQPSQVALMMALLIAVYAAGLFWVNRGRLLAGSRRRCITGTMLAIVVAAAIALPQAAFTWAFMVVSNRPSQPLAQSQALDTSLDTRALWTYLSPNALHSLRGAYDGPAGDIESFLYIGAIPALLMFGLGSALKIRSDRRHIGFFAFAALLAALYSFGPNTPFYAWAYHWIPGVDKFRRPADAAFIMNLSAAVIVGISASYVDLASRRTILAMVAGAMVWLAVSSAMMAAPGHTWQVATIVAALIAAIALCSLTKRSSASRSAFWLLLILVADYRCFNLNGKFNQWHDNAKHFLAEPAAKALAGMLKQNGLPQRFESVDGGTIWKNNTVLLDLSATQGYGPLQLAIYNRYMGYYANSSDPRPNSPYNPDPSSKINQLLGVRYLVKQNQGSNDTRTEKRVFTGKDVNIYELVATYPRILTPSSAKILDVAQMPPSPAFSATDFLAETWLLPRTQTEAAQARELAASCTASANVLDASQTNISVDLHVTSTAPAWVVVSNLDAPGWRARANEAALPIFRANGMFQAICVPKGDSHVVMTFHPWLMVVDVLRSYSNTEADQLSLQPTAAANRRRHHPMHIEHQQLIAPAP
ncbi:hypothetical protein [Dyella flagellata]|uniref:YfhO family protein n=1 Tax=Dyella flagellata TaxID=1867833 RepID=A0ABQ5XDL2_9GAMM|nr:hypothetical protein [Dyella flagellata]GLQ88738.1 hypothetical protein GCM10007898_23080 [Dyella flagellata]